MTITKGNPSCPRNIVMMSSIIPSMTVSRNALLHAPIFIQKALAVRSSICDLSRPPSTYGSIEDGTLMLYLFERRHPEGPHSLQWADSTHDDATVAPRRRSPISMTAGINSNPPTSANATPSEVTSPISTSGAKLEVISAPKPTIVVRFD